MKKKSVLLFDLAGAPQILLALIRTLASSGQTAIHVLCDNPKDPSRLSRHVSSFRSIPARLRDEAILERLIPAILGLNIDVLLPSDEESVRFLADHRHALSPHCAVSPLPESRALATSRDKWLLHEELGAGDVPAPRTLLLREESGHETIPPGFRFPALVKDRIGAGGHGIIRIDRPEDLPGALRRSPAPPRSRLLQEFVPGYDIDCSLLCKDGKVLAWTVQRGILAGSSPYGAPAGIRFVKDPGPLATATAWASHSGWSGVAHLDLRYDERDDQYRIVEVNPRYWRSLLGSLVAGVNFPLCACRTALGETYPAPRQTDALFIHESRESFRQLMAGLAGGSPDRFRWSQTNLSFAARDPLPDILLYFQP
jgi:predicted ATP-grasp superfamily ATP-dependent carboligase